MTTNDVLQAVIAEFGRKYIWWKPVGGQPHSEDRIIAQTMNFGTWDDTLLLEQTVGKSRLVEIMLRAEPGWFSDRSWEFWRGRLSFATGAAIPDKAPRRSFHAAAPSCGSASSGSGSDSLQTRDGTLPSASLDDLMATKLKATLDRAEAKDYRDIAEMISAGVSLPAGVSAFRAMFNGEPSQVLRSIGYFEDGDLHGLAESDRRLLRNARDRVGQLPDVTIRSGSLTGR
ncbi:MAG: hypothetical protein QOJ86_2377 [Bradyrhizobium sp.]|jgi:hypothetical protein|nr:hypothetical protein [Bradyrhizobium sp.]